MEVGKTCILMNMDELYESLYDVLNQYYSFLGQNKFVDLGLGAHRVKCRVDDNFKLLVMASCDVAYKFPIPLLNRLEKHLFSVKTILSDAEKQILDKLSNFASK